MVKPFDLTKFKKDHAKKTGAIEGFFDPITWIDTGNFALNKMISNDFNRGIPLGAVTTFAGESGAGKSYIVSGNIVKDALAKDCIVVLLDTEDALKESWMRNLGVDPDHPNLVKYIKSTVNQIAEVINDFMSRYIATYKDVPREEQQKVLFVVDSLGFVETEAEIAQFEAGEMKGDKGIKAKMLKMLVANCIRLFAGYEVGMVCTNHTYKSQSQYDHEDVVSGGSGFIYASSIIVSMTKSKLNEKVKEGSKTKTVTNGIIANIKCVKSRYAKPFEQVKVEIPYDTGMDRYSGVSDMMLANGTITQSGSWFTAHFADGSTAKKQGEDFDPAVFDRLMSEWVSRKDVPTGVDEVEEEDADA